MDSAGNEPQRPDSGFFDLQVNGYAGVDFNQDELSDEDLHLACERLESDGVEAILATIITEHADQMLRRIANLARLREQDPVARRILAGLHIEGPFLNERDGYRGAHPADAILPADVALMDRLLDAADGLVRLVTLAPERDAGFKVIKLLQSRQVAVSAGHCDASLDQLKGAADAGLSMFTHLGNGCPMQMNRHDNIIQRALSLSHRLWLCFIADGVHVPFFALKNYLRTAGVGRCIVVTDGIAPAGLGPGRYTVGRWELDIGPDMVARAPDGSHLVGAAITMAQSHANLVEQVGLTAREAELLLVGNPHQALSCLGGGIQTLSGRLT